MLQGRRLLLRGLIQRANRLVELLDRLLRLGGSCVERVQVALVLLQGLAHRLVSQVEITMDDLQISIHPGVAAIQLTGPAHLREKGGVANGDRCRATAVSLLRSKDEPFVGPSKQLNRWDEWRLAPIGEWHGLPLSGGNAQQQLGSSAQHAPCRRG